MPAPLPQSLSCRMILVGLAALAICRWQAEASAESVEPASSAFLQAKKTSRLDAVTASSVPSAFAGLPKECGLVAGCRDLSGDCCPAPDGTYLACCGSPPPQPKACGLVPGCRGLSGDCCPAPDGNFLACCGAREHGPALDMPPADDSQVHPMIPSCDHANVGYPNCGDSARCQGEYTVSGSTRTLRATTDSCAYVTFRTGLSLKELMYLDAEVFITPGTCSAFDNIAFWFFQTSEEGDALEQPAEHWDALSEVDLMETYIGNGGVNSVNTNFAAHGDQRHWQNVTIEGGVRQHITMWQDKDNSQGCPATRRLGFVFGDEPIVDYGKDLPVVSIYVAHCAPGQPCCKGDGCRLLQTAPDVAKACITVKEAPILFALSNWGAGHRVTPGCELGVSDVRVRTA